MVRTTKPNKKVMKMAKSKKKILGLIKLQIPAGKANPSPPVGPALGQKGLNIMEFCKAFNAATQKMEPGIPVPVVITAFEDKSFTFETKLPPVSYYFPLINARRTNANSSIGSSASQQCPNTIHSFPCLYTDLLYFYPFLLYFCADFR